MLAGICKPEPREDRIGARNALGRAQLVSRRRPHALGAGERDNDVVADAKVGEKLGHLERAANAEPRNLAR